VPEGDDGRTRKRSNLLIFTLASDTMAARLEQRQTPKQ
jgi:hypothetical protein